MKKLLMATLITAMAATTVNASIADKKAIRGADAKIATEVAATKAACGNAALGVSVSWDNVKSMITANSDKLKSKNYQSQWVISHVSDITVSTLQALSKVCKQDADYKEEIANIKSFTVNPKMDFGDTKTEFALKANVLEVSAGHYMTRSSSDFIKSLKALY